MRITAAATPPTTAAVNRPGGRASDSSPGSPPELVAAFKSYYGPTMNAFAAAAADGREADLQAELETLFEEQNTSEDATSIPATFLRVTVQRYFGD